jgi:hypothetical protein
MMLGDSLGTYVFQSVYVAKEENAFSEVLKELGEKDARHEAHARAVVLSLYNNNQEQYGEALAAMAARETMDTISGLVPKADHPKLVKQLQSFCHEAMLRWLPVQRLNELVMADIDAVANEYWKILPFPVHDITNQQAQQSNTVQGDGSSNGSAKNRSSQNQRHRSTAAQSVRLTDNDEVYEIWPAFKTQKQTLCQGFIVMEKLRQEAKKDEEAVRQKEEELRRSGRKLSRKGTGDATNGGGQTRQATGGSFLSSGNGKASAVG